MPTFTFATLNELTAYLQSQIASNGTQNITGQKHQDVVVTIAQSLVNIISSVPPTTVNQFPTYDVEQVYAGGVEIIVRHSNKLYLFVSGSDQVGVTPGTNALVWQEVSAAQLAHFQNRDQYLDEGGSHQVSAEELYNLIHQPGGSTFWIAPVQQYNVVSEAAADAGGWTRVLVGATPSGLFTGHAHALAVKTAGTWSYTDIATGALVENTATGNLLIRRSTGWAAYNVSIPSIAQVMAVGATTSGTLALGGALVRNALSLTHSSPGTLNVTMANTSVARVTVSADITLNPTSIYSGGDWVVTLIGAAASAVAFGSLVYFPTGITAPTDIALNEVIIMKGYGYNSRLAITSVSRFTGI